MEHQNSGHDERSDCCVAPKHSLVSNHLSRTKEVPGRNRVLWACIVHLFLQLCVRPFMRVPVGMMAIALIPVWVCAPANSAAAQSFNDRWSIIPKAHAEPAPEAPAKQDTRERLETQNTSERTGAGEPTVQPDVHSGRRSSKRVFSGKASYYSYPGGKTASGAPFNRHSLTAAHRNLPFGTKVRVIDLASSKSVVVRITDRGPWIRGRVLDLSLGAARNLGISEKGVARVRAEVL